MTVCSILNKKYLLSMKSISTFFILFYLSLPIAVLSQSPLSNEIQLSHDSLYVHLKTDNEKSKDFDWVPLVSTVLGGLLVYIGQWVERDKIKHKDTKKNIIENIYQAHYNLNVLRRLLYDLAYYKVDIQLQDCRAEMTMNDDEKKSYLNEYYKNFSQLAEVSNKITDTAAKLISTVVNYNLLCKSAVTESEIEKLVEIIFSQKATPYNEEPDQEKVDHDVEELYQILLVTMLPFTTVVNKLKLTNDDL